MDFATLQQARQGLQNSDAQRHKQSADLYAQGRQLIREAIGQQPNKVKLKQAVDCFSRGIQFNHRNPSNYFGMALLFLLLGKTREALPYIKAALEIEPQSELGRELLQQAQTLFQTNPSATASLQTTALAPPHTSAGKVDVDELYDSAEVAVMLLLKQIMCDEVMGYQPSPNQMQYEQLQSKLKLFQEKAQGFQEQLQLLDQELEVTNLRRHLATVDQALKRIANLVEVSKEFIDIHQDIQKHRDLTLEVIAKSEATDEPNDIEIFEENLQALLDHCDGMADRIDNIEKKRIDISSLQLPYEEYAAQLERFQDILEETIERLV